MGLPIRIETRTGDTPAHKRQRQKLAPPDILLTTPEQLALLIAGAGCRPLLRGPALRRPRRAAFAGHLQARPSAVARPRAPAHARARRCRRSAFRRPSPSRTTARAGWCAQDAAQALMAEPDHRRPAARKPGHHHPRFATSACPGPATPRATRSPRSTRRSSAHRTTLLFVNTRSQAELLFQELWRINDDILPIALHHGSLDVGQRRKVEAAMAANRLRAVVAHLDARSRHRLGRCRSRHPCRRAEGRQPPRAAHRPRQSPHGRAVAARSSCRPTASR